MFTLLTRRCFYPGGSWEGPFEEPLCSQIATIMDENRTWQMSLVEKLHQANGDNDTDNNRQKRARTDR